MKERKIIVFGLIIGIIFLWMIGSLALWVTEFMQISIPRLFLELVLGAGIMFLGQFIYHITNIFIKGEIPHEDEE